jgi:hypothetical protein
MIKFNISLPKPFNILSNVEIGTTDSVTGRKGIFFFTLPLRQFQPLVFHEPVFQSSDLHFSRSLGIGHCSLQLLFHVHQILGIL